jgi:hypothetical protein
MPWQLQFFLPLAVGLCGLAWLGQSAAKSRQFTRYAKLFLVTWLGASLVLFLLMSVSIRWEVDQSPTRPNMFAILREFGAFCASYAVPFVFTTSLLLTLGRRWSREAHVMWAFSAAVAFAFVSPLLAIIAACFVQHNCL